MPTATPLYMGTTEFEEAVFKALGSLSGFQLSGSMMIRSFLAKASDTVSVLDFPGVDPTGTTDSTAGIQEAIDFVKDGGGVYFPNGTYLLSDVLIPYTDVNLFGESEMGTILKQTSSSSNHFHGVDVDRVVIRNMTLSGMGIDSVGGGGIYLALSGNSNVEGTVMENVTVRDNAGGGITINTPITSIFNNVKCVKLVGNGFDFFGGGTSIVMNACYGITCTQAGFNFTSLCYSTLNACATESCGVGYDLSNCNNVALVGCGSEGQLNRSTEYPGIGFRIDGGVGNSLISPYDRDSDLYGIALYNGTSSIHGYRQLGSSPTASLYVDASVEGVLVNGIDYAVAPIINSDKYTQINKGVTITRHHRKVNALGNITGAVSIDLASGDIISGTMTGDCVFTFTNLPATGYVADVELRLTQDATGSRLATWPAGGKWPNTTPLVLTTTANAADYVSLSVESDGSFTGNPLKNIG